jgi:tyrosyl-tRNA synthetase
MVARRLAEAGWKPVLLVGGATSLIGDPGGKEEERALKSREEIAANVAGIKAQVSRLFADREFTLVDNFDWFKEIGYLEFLREVGKHFSMTELVQRDYIATRIGEGGGGISYAEFSYSLIQGYDFWHLFKNYGVEMQIGGSDQWGNILSGVPLIRKKEAKEVHAFSMPLVIDKTTGKKFGKSEAGAVWLDPAKTSPTQFYQFWINCDDEGVEDYFKIYTMLDRETIETIMAQHREHPSERVAQKRLAEEITIIVHGEEATNIAQAVTDVITRKTSVGDVGLEVIDALRQEQPSAKVTAAGSLVDTLVETGLASSNTEARRLIKDNAISINGTKVAREVFEAVDFQAGKVLLQRGKKFKDTALIELSS